MNTNFARPGIGISPFTGEGLSSIGWQNPLPSPVSGISANLPGASETFIPSGWGIPSLGGSGALGRLGGFFKSPNLAGNLSAAFNGFQTIGSLYAGFKALDLAKKQLRFSKDIANANLLNQTQSYNTALEDRIRSRAVTEGRPQGYVDDYIARNSLQKRTVG